MIYKGFNVAQPESCENSDSLTPDAHDLKISESTEAADHEKRVSRYGRAKKTTINLIKGITATKQKVLNPKTVKSIETCGDYLLFHNFVNIGKIKLMAASFCKVHALCQLCGIRRGAKYLKKYLEKLEQIGYNPKIHILQLITLTIKDGADLSERFKHLKDSYKTLNNLRTKKTRKTPLDNVLGAVSSFEIKRGKNSGLWHPHIHIIALSPKAKPVDQNDLAAKWLSITKDSHIVDVRNIKDDIESGFCEVFKYITDYKENDPKDTLKIYQLVKNQKQIGRAHV